MLKRFNIDEGVIREIQCQTHALEKKLTEADRIDAHEPNVDERPLLQRMLHTELQESYDIEEIEASARCFVDQAGIHVHSLFLAQGEGRHDTESVACILQKERLITIRENDLADFRLRRMWARLGQVKAKTPQDLLVTLKYPSLKDLFDHHKI